jgi:hypothetical protein
MGVSNRCQPRAQDRRHGPWRLGVATESSGSANVQHLVTVLIAVVICGVTPAAGRPPVSILSQGNDARDGVSASPVHGRCNTRPR